MAEDTDLTYRLLLAGWKTAYENRAECYEEVPERWPVRVRQIMRWAKGHNQAMTSYIGRRRRRAVGWTSADGVLLLGVYLMGPVLLLGWVLAVVLFYTGVQLGGGLTVLALGAFTTLGNFAAFFEIAAAARLDGSRQRIRLLPLTLFGFTVSLISVSHAAWQQAHGESIRNAEPGVAQDRALPHRSGTGRCVVAKRTGTGGIDGPRSLLFCAGRLTLMSAWAPLALTRGYCGPAGAAGYSCIVLELWRRDGCDSVADYAA